MDSGFQKMEQLVTNVREVNLLSEDEESEDGILTVSEASTDSGLSVTSTKETIFNDDESLEEVDEEIVVKKSNEKGEGNDEPMGSVTNKEILTSKMATIMNESIRKMIDIQMANISTNNVSSRKRITGPNPDSAPPPDGSSKEAQIAWAKSTIAKFEKEGFGEVGYGATPKRFRDRRDERKAPYERINERNERKVDPQYKRIMSDKTGIDSIQRRMKKFGEDPTAFGQCLHYIKEETKERLKKGNFELPKLTNEQVSQFRPCLFYQVNKCRQTLYSNVHLDKLSERNKKAYVHGCALCHKLSFGIYEHSMNDCMVVAELDIIDDNKSFLPKILRRKNE